MLLQYGILDVYFLTKMLSHAKKLENVIYTQEIRAKRLDLAEKAFKAVHKFFQGKGNYVKNIK